MADIEYDICTETGKMVIINYGYCPCCGVPLDSEEQEYCVDTAEIMKNKSPK